jgi:hypothetical protein
MALHPNALVNKRISQQQNKQPMGLYTGLELLLQDDLRAHVAST